MLLDRVNWLHGVWIWCTLAPGCGYGTFISFNLSLTNLVFLCVIPIIVKLCRIYDLLRQTRWFGKLWASFCSLITPVASVLVKIYLVVIFELSCLRFVISWSLNFSFIFLGLAPVPSHGALWEHIRVEWKRQGHDLDISLRLLEHKDFLAIILSQSAFLFLHLAIALFQCHWLKPVWDRLDLETVEEVFASSLLNAERFLF